MRLLVRARVTSGEGLHTRVIVGLDPTICGGHRTLGGLVLDVAVHFGPNSPMGGFVYIMANRRRGPTYIGVTSDLVRRVYQHRTKAGGAHTRRYNIARLVWFEEHADIRDAIQREKALKKWEQAWKYDLIENANPHWDDLWDEVAASF